MKPLNELTRVRGAAEAQSSEVRGLDVSMSRWFDVLMSTGTGLFFSHFEPMVKSLMEGSEGVPILVVGAASGMRGSSVGSWLSAYVLVSLMGGAEAVCVHCKDTIFGCTGGADCPLYKDLSANADVFKDLKLGSTLKLANALTPEMASHFMDCHLHP